MTTLESRGHSIMAEGINPNGAKHRPIIPEVVIFSPEDEGATPPKKEWPELIETERTRLQQEITSLKQSVKEGLAGLYQQAQAVNSQNFSSDRPRRTRRRTEEQIRRNEEKLGRKVVKAVGGNSQTSPITLFDISNHVYQREGLSLTEEEVAVAKDIKSEQSRILSNQRRLRWLNKWDEYFNNQADRDKQINDYIDQNFPEARKNGLTRNELQTALHDLYKVAPEELLKARLNPKYSPKKDLTKNLVAAAGKSTVLTEKDGPDKQITHLQKVNAELRGAIEKQMEIIRKAVSLAASNQELQAANTELQRLLAEERRAREEFEKVNRSLANRLAEAEERLRTREAVLKFLDRINGQDGIGKWMSVLGIDRSWWEKLSPDEQLTSMELRYRALAPVLHPDHNGNTRLMQDVNKAHDELVKFVKAENQK